MPKSLDNQEQIVRPKSNASVLIYAYKQKQHVQLDSEQLLGFIMKKYWTKI